MSIIFHGLPTEAVRALQQGGPDAYGMTPERRVSDGDGVPWAERVDGTLFGVSVPFLGRDTLIRNKRASGRPKDLSDIAALGG